MAGLPARIQGVATTTSDRQRSLTHRGPRRWSKQGQNRGILSEYQQMESRVHDLDAEWWLKVSSLSHSVPPPGFPLGREAHQQDDSPDVGEEMGPNGARWGL